jgi:hypothetical protein
MVAVTDVTAKKNIISTERFHNVNSEIERPKHPLLPVRRMY